MIPKRFIVISHIQKLISFIEQFKAAVGKHDSVSTHIKELIDVHIFDDKSDNHPPVFLSLSIDVLTKLTNTINIPQGVDNNTIKSLAHQVFVYLVNCNTQNGTNTHVPWRSKRIEKSTGPKQATLYRYLAAKQRSH